MNMKKTTAIILAAVLALSLTGCSGGSGSAGNYGGTANAGNTGGGAAASAEKVTNKAIDVYIAGQTLSGTYSGEWENGKANGEGEFTFSDDGYEFAISGTFKNGEPSDGSFLQENSDGSRIFYVGKLSGGMPSDTNAYLECDRNNGDNFRYQGTVRSGNMEGEGDIVYVMSDGQYVRYIGTFTNNKPTSGDYQVYSSSGNLVESGQIINGEKKTDTAIAAENFIDNIGRAVEQHFGYSGIYDGLKSLLS